MNHLFADTTGEDPEEFYLSLKAKLEENHNFPEDYLYKFIFPNDNLKLTELYQIFDRIKYTISTRESQYGKYFAERLLLSVLEANQLIELYKIINATKGIIMLCKSGSKTENHFAINKLTYSRGQPICASGPLIRFSRSTSS